MKLTLLLIFLILFINHPVFAQSSENEAPLLTSRDKVSVSVKRLEVMERYLGWIEAGQYGEYKQSLPEGKEDLGKKTLNEFKSFLSRVNLEDQACLTQTEKQALTDCRGKIKFDFKLAKKYNRVLKYLQIAEGKPNVCVKADLGVGTALKARGFNPTKVASDNPKETGRTGELPVYLCTGQDGKKKVRVVDDSGTRLRLSPEDAAKTEFKVENLPPRNSFNKLLEKLGL